MDATKRRDIPTPRALREMADRLNALAVAMEGPTPRTMATARAETCTCDVCGGHIGGLRWIGERCDTLTMDRRLRKPVACRGVYRLDPEPITDEQIGEAAMYEAMGVALLDTYRPDMTDGFGGGE